MDTAATSFAVAFALGLATLAAVALWLREVQRREHQHAIEREQQMHQERIAAIGAMAAGVLREIGNPIAAIDGYARAMVDAQKRGEMAPAPAADCDPALIVGEAGRLVAITREMSELASTSPRQRQLVHANELVAHTLALLRYDPRLERTRIDTAFDPQLPAVSAVPERLVLLLTQLVTEALEAGSRRIGICTRRAAGGIEIEVAADRGAPAADAGLARAIAQEHGGMTKIKSTPRSGTLVRVRLPIAPID